jgi:hypothetical protein
MEFIGYAPPDACRVIRWEHVCVDLLAAPRCLSGSEAATVRRIDLNEVAPGAPGLRCWMAQCTRCWAIGWSCVDDASDSEDEPIDDRPQPGAFERGPEPLSRVHPSLTPR